MTLIFNSYQEFLNREDEDINGVSTAFAEAYPNYGKDNETNKGCWNCSYCSDCSGCSGCSDKHGYKKKNKTNQNNRQ